MNSDFVVEFSKVTHVQWLDNQIITRQSTVNNYCLHIRLKFLINQINKYNCIRS